MQARGSFQNHLRRSLILYTALFVILLFLLYIVFTTVNLRVTTMQVNAQDNRELTASMTIWQGELVEALQSLSGESAVREALRLGTPAAITRANRLLYQRINRLPLKVVFTLLSPKGEIAATNLNRDNQAVFLTAYPNAAVREQLESSELPYCERHSRIGYRFDQETVWLFATRVMEEGELLGYLYLDVMDAGLRDAMRFRQSDAVVLADRFDNVLYTDTPQAVGDIGKLSVRVDGGGFVTMDAKEYFVSVGTLADSGVRVMTFTSTVLHRQMMRYGMTLIALMALALVAIVPLVADRVARRNLRPIETMVQTVRNQDLNSRIRERTFDEFQLLYDEFNAMMERVQTLIHHNEELVERKRIIEVKHLKEQFNPHFVFNVMENLHFVLLTDPQKAADMLVAFASLMRYEIDETQPQVALETDIEYVNDYLLLQKMRYGKLLTYTFDIPDALLQCRVPKLLIQPIVENSLKYAMPPEGGIHLQVTARMEKRYLIIRIEDDGLGMQPEQLRRLTDMLAQEDAVTTHIGLYNTHRALRLMYGAPCGLTLSNAPGHGTVVELRLPKEWDDA